MVLADRAASMLATGGGLVGLAAWKKHRQAKRAAKRDAAEAD